MTNYRDSVYFNKLILSEGIPKEFLPNLDDNDSVISDTQYNKNPDEESDKESNISEVPEKNETQKKPPYKKLEWPLCCWICRQPIVKRKTYIICTGMCKRSYHIKCHSLMKNHFQNLFDKILASKKNQINYQDLNKSLAELGLELQEYDNELEEKNQDDTENNHLTKPETNLVSTKKQQYSNKESRSNSDHKIQYDTSASKKCFFCKISHVGCNGCRKFFREKNLVKCCVEECNTFYCYPKCLSKTRIIIPDKKVIDINMSICGHLHNLVDSNGRPKFICHSHTCWSCYDCDRYSYHWETYWRNEQGKTKSSQLVSAWNSLKVSCRGKVESSHFAKGKKIPKPQRYPDMTGFRTFLQSKAGQNSFNSNTDDLYNSSDDDEEYFQKGPSTILVKCVRCDRTWCTHCVHPDVHILPKSAKQIVCHDCIHIQVGCTLAQNSKEANNSSNLMKKECIYPTIRLETGVTADIYKQLSNFIAEHSVYEKKLNLEPSFIIKQPTQDSDDDNQLLDLHKSAILKAKSKKNKEKEQKNKDNKKKERKDNEASPTRSVVSDVIPKSFTDMKSREWNTIVKGCDESVLNKISSEFKYVTSNVVPQEYRKLISAPDQENRCQCVKKCGPDCNNVLKNVECTSKNCALSDNNCGNRKFANFLVPKLKLNYVEGKGIGAVATEDIDKNELVCEYVGEVITHSDFQESLASSSFAEIDDNNKCHWYIMKVHKDMYIDSTHLGNVARFINHSCDPNCASIPIVVRGTYRMGVFSIKNIKKGEEVTYNYGFTSKGVGGGFRCKCKSKNCRGIIGTQQVHSPESLMNIESSKSTGAEVDVLSQLTSDMASLTVANKTQSLKQQPSPLDVLNGIWTAGDLHRYEKVVSNLDNNDKTPSSKHNSELKETVNPLLSLLEDNAHVSDAQFNYIKMLALNSNTMLEFDIANTKQFATNIPWAIVAMGHKDISQNVSMECSTGYFDFYPLAKRFIQISSMLLSRERFGKVACENIQDLMDLTWGGTEPCSACGGYGDCRWCDNCGDVLHDDNNCGDFYVNKEGENICTLCQNSDHRYKWYVSSNIEKENMAMELWSIKMKKRIEEEFMLFRSLCNKKSENNMKVDCKNEDKEENKEKEKEEENEQKNKKKQKQEKVKNKNKEKQEKIKNELNGKEELVEEGWNGMEGVEGMDDDTLYVDGNRMLCTSEEYELFKRDPCKYYELQKRIRDYCVNSVTNFEC